MDSYKYNIITKNVVIVVQQLSYWECYDITH